jgi:hypothetical protein
MSCNITLITSIKFSNILRPLSSEEDLRSKTKKVTAKFSVLFLILVVHSCCFSHQTERVKKGKAFHVTGREGSTFSLDSRLTDSGKFVSLTRRSPYTPRRFLANISIRGWVYPRAIVRLEELDIFKKKKNPPHRNSNPLPSGIVPQPPTLTSARFILNSNVNFLTNMHNTLHVIIHIKLIYGEELLVSRPSPKLEVLYCRLFNIFVVSEDCLLHQHAEDAPCRGDKGPT